MRGKNLETNISMNHKLSQQIRHRPFFLLYLVLFIIAVFTTTGLFPIGSLWNGIFILSLISWVYFYGISVIIRKLLPDELKEKLAKTMQIKYLIWAAIGIFIVAFGLKERFVYFWDYGGYWGTGILYTDNWFNDVHRSLSQLYTSILNDEYNLLPTLLLLLPFKLIGITFPAYTLSIYIMYIIPFYAITFSLVIRIAYDMGRPLSDRIIITCTACLCFLPPVIEPILAGYLDAVGLPICISILAIVYLKEKHQLNRLSASMGLTILLVILVFSRRWFAYWIVAFFISYGLILILRLFSKEQRNAAIKSILDIALIGICCSTFLFVGFREFLIRSLLTNYGDIYSAYQSGNFYGNVKFGIHYIGIWLLFLAAIGFIGAIRMPSNRWFFSMILIQSMISFSLFVTVQSMGMQHYYLISSALAIFVLFGVVTVLNLTQKRIINKVILISVLVITAGGFFKSFVPQPIPLVDKLSRIYSNGPFHPRVRNDLNEIRQLGSYISEISGVDPASSKQNIYVLASSVIINDDIIRKVNLPYTINSIPSLLQANHVDKRDGFPKQLLEADVVVVGDPIQYHMRDTDQRVVGVLANEFLKNEGIGKSFRLDKTFTLDNNVKAKVYIKEKPLNIEDLKKLQSQFQEWYPELADKFKIVD